MAAMDVCLDVIARQRRQGRRRQDLAARQGQGDRDAPPPAAGRAHVHRRRLQLRRADRRRRAGLFRRAARHLRRDRAGGRRPRSARSRAATCTTFHDILAPTVPLSRHIFKAPTRFYKTGVVFMAYLNGLQDHFTMVGGQESARSTLHLAELFRLADAAGLLRRSRAAPRARMRARAGGARRRS